MSRDSWSNRLEEMKKCEAPETVLVVAGSTQLTRVVVAWIGIGATRRRRLSSCKGSDDETVWRWLWENVTFPEDWFYSRISGGRDKAEQNFAVLVANRVLYPDGTVNGFVERYLREKVLSLFRIPKKDKPAA